jgi:hypothetical protein
LNKGNKKNQHITKRIAGGKTMQKFFMSGKKILSVFIAFAMTFGFALPGVAPTALAAQYEQPTASGRQRPYRPTARTAIISLRATRLR